MFARLIRNDCRKLRILADSAKYDASYASSGAVRKSVPAASAIPTAWAPRVVVTVHPSAVLRSQAEGARYFEMLVSDLTLAGAGRAAPDAGGQT